ncbi:MAG: hypothetical protein LBL79_08675 [Prevotella sp.]|jgi:hypothetical protein|nr:hypothetical protein [Prevotella sp.]
MNIELYIGGRLCDIGNPENLGIYLKRVFIKPSELSIKDAQKSYEMSLPATAVNNAIFNYTNVEEVQGKFKVYDNVRLYIDGILIFDGKFRMSQITRDAYIGNLGVPAPKTVKDIFGETMMNQAGKWLIPFSGVQSITDYNTGKYETEKYGENAPCIFPLVLYKLLQKGKGSTSKKNVLDKTVKFNLYDFPPSVNCVHLLRQLFKSAKYNLTGTALTDERIKNLYVSYKNSNNYEMPWNANKIALKGDWTNYDGKDVEKRGTMNEVDSKIYAINLFNASNSNINILSDNGLNIGQTGITIPYSGLYKIRLDAGIALSQEINNAYSGEFYKVVEPNSVFHPIPSMDVPVAFNLTNRRFEVKLLRNFSDLNEARHDNTFYKDNQYQSRETNELFLPDNGKVNFIDPKQNKHMLCGFAWGYNSSTPDYKNPLNKKNCNPMAIKGGKSWSDDVSDRSFAATSSPGYKKKIGDNTSSTNTLRVDLLNSFQLVDHIDTATIGAMNQIIWLDKGDNLSIIATSDGGAYVYGTDKSQLGWLRHKINFELSITPFRHDKSWLTVGNDGSSDKPMDWNDKPTFDSTQLDLVKFLPAEIKINDWIDNFCKTFNLNLNSKDNNNFELNLKNNIINSSAPLIDLDTQIDVKQCTSESLNLPSVYEIGFTIDTGEEGYFQTMDETTDDDGEIIKVVNSGDKGGGTYYIDNEGGPKISQTSNFSYNWFKTLYNEDNKEVVAEVPVITDNDIWRNEYDYEETRTKEFYDKAQRLWYPSGLLPLTVGDQIDISAAKVSDSYEGKQKMSLNYKDEQDSILRNYFLMMINSDNNYTIAECYLTAQEYANLNKSLIKLNGDLYYAAEADGYDPLNKKKCRLKLIRKII